MSQFNSYQNKKDDSAQNDINQRLSQHNSLFLPHEGTQSTSQYQNDNLLRNSKNYHTNENNNSNKLNDKSDFKDQINNRMNTFQRNIEIGQRQLPFNNNIRDYTVTCDSKKDVFNNRLSNYNYLSSNIPPQIQEQNNVNKVNFHKTFREDTNQRIQELSPLSCNLGIPQLNINPPSMPDFNKNLPVENNHPIQEEIQYSNQFQKEINSEESTEMYLQNYQKMSEESQSSILSNSYDNSNYGLFKNSDNSHTQNYASTPNKLYSQTHNPQSPIKGFDYSMINNSIGPNQSKSKVNSINQLPQLAVNTNLPVDTRQEFHFHQNFNQ